jgi:serine/threonine protein kinase
MRGRLEQEARISARLQHPGIVPVHELSHLADGRPFVSMKLIEGKTLGELLASSNGQTQTNLLEIFVKACEAMAYSHEQNIIHRDLKPSNIMVGAFNEVQLMDWGLAKELKTGQVESQFNPPLRSSLAPDRSQTLVGSVFGTIAYMPPEQARGEVDRIDKRSDVFALGGILCAILTGLPVYDGSDTDMLLSDAQSGSVSPAVRRIRKSRAPSRLKTLAIDCISSDAENRPLDAGALLYRLTAVMKPNKRMRWLWYAISVIGVSVAIIIALIIVEFYFLTNVEIR